MISNTGRRRGARIALWAHAALTAAFLTAIWACVPVQQAYAYVDPSVMTYTIQALAGLVVALSAVAGVAFRRTRRKIYQVFKIDENANKAVEGEVGRIDPASPGAGEALETARERAKALEGESEAFLRRRSVRDMPWRARFGFAVVITLFVAFIVFIAPALEIFGANGDSLVFGLTVTWWIPVVFCVPLAVAAAAAIACLKGRPFYVVMLVLFLLGLAAYIQSLFLNYGMMPADGGYIGWNEPFFIERKITSGIVWLLVIAVPLVVSWHYQHTGLKVATALACAIMIMQGVGVASVAMDASKLAVDEQSKPYVTQGGLLSVSPNDNVVVFVLDTYDTSILEKIRAADPHYLDTFTGFTYFPDSAGTMIPTTNAVPNLLTGLKPAPGQELGEYRYSKYEKSTFVDDIIGAGYSVGVYSDSLMLTLENPADRAFAAKTVNVHPVASAPLDVWQTFLAMEQCALYREAPWLLKEVFWYYTSDVNNRMIADGDAASLDDTLYELDDAAILGMLRAQGLKAVDGASAGAFRFIHLFGPHFPYSVDENGQEVATNASNEVDQAKGSMLVVIEYMNRLRELGLYDKAAIIVTADHGIWNLTEDPVEKPISPIMLVKPAHQTHDEASTPCVVSANRVSHDDVQGTVVEAMGMDPAKYGITVFQATDPDRVRYFDALTNVGDQGQHFVEYAISGDVSDLSTWSKTGNVWYGA